MVLGVSLAAIAITLWARAAGLAVDWFPYPALSVPAVSPAMLVAALLPAVAIWR